MSKDVAQDPWGEDLLGYKEIGETYANLVASISEAKVISIEAGFGRGKTFFRKAWADHLRQQSEIVIEVDAQRSDHSGDPVIAFMGALIEHLPSDGDARRKALEKGKKIAGLAARTVLRVLARNAAEEAIEAITDRAADQVDGMETLEDTVNELGEGMSKLAGNLIASHLAAEQVRTKELPEQLAALHKALTDGREGARIVILIDELDRCHPEYAIALLEAMKLVFDFNGFVFVLLVNADYLENLAAHRFGKTGEGERYLDKFVDIRLGLPVTDASLSSAARALAARLPLELPFGNDPEFSVDRAARLAGELAPVSKLSMRQIERVLLRVELALRCYRTVPLDCALLVFLAFKDAVAQEPTSELITEEEFLSRALLTPSIGERFMHRGGFHEDERRKEVEAEEYVNKYCRELCGIPNDRFRLPDNRNYHPWAKVTLHLAKHYLPDHERILNAVHKLQVEDTA